MSLRKINKTISVTTDGVTTRLIAGTLIHVTPGSALETALGTSNLNVGFNAPDQGQGGHATSNGG